MSKNTGGPAFPVFDADDGRVVEGMTLRDYFAVKAMQKTMIEFDNAWDTHAYERAEFLQWASERAYAMADAMLKAKNK